MQNSTSVITLRVLLYNKYNNRKCSVRGINEDARKALHSSHESCVKFYLSFSIQHAPHHLVFYCILIFRSQPCYFPIFFFIANLLVDGTTKFQINQNKYWFSSFFSFFKLEHKIHQWIKWNYKIWLQTVVFNENIDVSFSYYKGA